MDSITLLTFLPELCHNRGVSEPTTNSIYSSTTFLCILGRNTNEIDLIFFCVFDRSKPETDCSLVITTRCDSKSIYEAKCTILLQLIVLQLSQIRLKMLITRLNLIRTVRSCLKLD